MQMARPRPPRCGKYSYSGLSGALEPLWGSLRCLNARRQWRLSHTGPHLLGQRHLAYPGSPRHRSERLLPVPRPETRPLGGIPRRSDGSRKPLSSGEVTPVTAMKTQPPDCDKKMPLGSAVAAAAGVTGMAAYSFHSHARQPPRLI